MLVLDRCVRHAAEIAELIEQLEPHAGICGECHQQPCQCANLRDPEWLSRMEAEIETARP